MKGTWRPCCCRTLLSLLAWTAVITGFCSSMVSMSLSLVNHWLCMPVTVGVDSSDNRVLQQHGLHVPFIGKPLVVHASHFEVLVVAAAGRSARGDITSAPGGVGVGRFLLVVRALIGDPVNISLGPSSITAITSPGATAVSENVVVGTIQQMLFRQVIGHVANSNLGAGLDSSNSSKSSTATALSLVLDRAHSSLVNPVEVLWGLLDLGHLEKNFLVEGVQEHSGVVIVRKSSSPLGQPFGLRQVHLIGHSHTPRDFSSSIPLIMLNHFLVILIEDGPSLHELSRVSVLLVEVLGESQKDFISSHSYADNGQENKGPHCVAGQ